MTTPVHTVEVDAPIAEAVRLLTEHHISSLPVIDAERHVVGMISEADLIDEHKREASVPRTLLYGIFPLPDDVVEAAARRGTMLQVRDLMTRPVVTAAEDASIHELADLIVQHWINQIPIVQEHRLVGIVSRSDLVRALAREMEDETTGHETTVMTRT